MDPISVLTGAVIGGGAATAARHFLTHREKREKGLADFLPWALLISDGVILLKDATFMGGFTIRGADLTSAPYESVNKAAEGMNDLIGQLPPGYSLEVNVHRLPHTHYPSAEVQCFPTDALRAVDLEREHHFTRPGSYYESLHQLLISFTPPREQVRKIEGLFSTGGHSTTNYASLLDTFQHTMDEVSDFLSPFFAVHRMDSTDIVTECHRCLSGDTDTVIPDGGYLCYALASGDFVPGYLPRFRDQVLFCVTVTSYGPSVEVASGDFFNGIRDEVRWHLRYLPLPRAKAERRIRTIQKNWFSKRKGIAQFMPGGGEDSATLEDPHAIAMQEESAEALAELTSGRARYGYLSNVIVIRDGDPKRGRMRADAIIQKAREAGYVALLETLNAPSAFLGSLPGAGSLNVRRLMVSSKVVSHLFPTTMPWAGDRYNPSALFPAQSPPLLMTGGKGATPFRLHLHHGDVGHTLVVGATGAGKSVLVGSLMMSWLRYDDSRVICFDVGQSHTRLTQSAGGDHLRFASKAERMQPLRHLDTEADKLWAESWVSGLCDLAEMPISPKDRVEISNAIKLTSEERSEHRTLSALHVNLPPAIQAVVEPYTDRGAYGGLFDGVTMESKTEPRMRTLELSDVLALGEPVIVPLLMSSFRQVERALDGNPTLIVIEEAWAALMRGEFSARLQQWLLTLRKQNASVIIVAHNPVQIKSLPNAGIITDSCPTRILLPNPEARVEEHAEVYRFLDLTAREIDTIASATPKREYYFRSPRGSRLFELHLGAEARRILIPPKISDPVTNGTHTQTFSHITP